VRVRRIAAAVDDVALFCERSLLREAIRAVQLVEVVRDQRALCVVPGTAADSIAGVDRGLSARRVRTQIGVPHVSATSHRAGARLADLIRTRQSAEVRAISGAGAGDKETHRSGIRRRHR
jgi:hypothetical protein